MKTTLSDHKQFIEELDKEPNKIRRIVMLREWLEAHGYEDIANCKHHTLTRKTGRCSSCGVQVSEPVLLDDNEERLAALRAKLTGDVIDDARVIETP